MKYVASERERLRAERLLKLADDHAKVACEKNRKVS